MKKLVLQLFSPANNEIGVPWKVSWKPDVGTGTFEAPAFSDISSKRPCVWLRLIEAHISPLFIVPRSTREYGDPKIRYPIEGYHSEMLTFHAGILDESSYIAVLSAMLNCNFPWRMPPVKSKHAR